MMIVSNPGSKDETRTFVPSSELNFSEIGSSLLGGKSWQVSTNLKVTYAVIWLVEYDAAALNNLDVGSPATISSAGGISTPDAVPTSNPESEETENPAASLIQCPTGFIEVPFNVEVGTSKNFCVMKFESKIVGKDDGKTAEGTSIVESRSSGTAWTLIGRDDAIAKCQGLGTGYDLISNAQWQTIARNIENAKNGSGVYLNWSNGSTSGANFLNRGNSDAVVTLSYAASTDDNPCFMTGNANCTNIAHSDYSQKRTHTLSNGEIIWDLAGNVSEWIRHYTDGIQETDGYLSQRPYNFGTELKWGPSGDYSAKTAPEYGGLGYAALSFTNMPQSVHRGGYYEVDGDHWSGIFAADISLNPYFPLGYVGFRCVFEK